MRRTACGSGRFPLCPFVFQRRAHLWPGLSGLCRRRAGQSFGSSSRWRFLFGFFLLPSPYSCIPLTHDHMHYNTKTNKQTNKNKTYPAIQRYSTAVCSMFLVLLLLSSFLSLHFATTRSGFVVVLSRYLVPKISSPRVIYGGNRARRCR